MRISEVTFNMSYLYELKKIFSHRIKLLVLLAVAAFLFFVSAQRYFTDVPESNAWKAEQLLDGRTMDENFFTEMRDDSAPDASYSCYHFQRTPWA